MGPVVRCLVLKVAILCSLCVWIDYSSSAPVVRRQTAENGAERNDSAIAWLKKFYYLPDKPNSAINETEYQDAIAALQNTGGLEETGILNSETISLLNTPRCGVFEAQPGGQEWGNTTRKKRYYLQGTYWKKLNLTYRFLQLTRDLPEFDQKLILRKMINKWAEVSPLTITEQTNPSVADDDVDILIRFVSGYHGDPYAFDGQGGTLAHAFYPHNNKGLSGDAHFDDDERFTTGTRDGINLDWVAVHEFGHSMGLEHSNVRESIMYPWYKGYFENIELTEDDILGIQALYGKPTVEPTKSTAEPTKTTAVTTKATSVTPEPQTTRPQTTPFGPDICTIQKYDQIFKGENGEIYVFSGEYYWVLAATLGVKSGPTKINSRWRELGTPINAAYKRKDGRTVFFKGSQYWKYYGNRLEEGPRDIANYGLPRELSDPDIAFIWGGNGKTYFFKGDNYWRYNEANRNVDNGYPRSIAIWGLPYAMDSALTYERNGRTYYFKDVDYWKYDDGALKLLGQNYGYPKNTHKVWEKCKLPTAP